MGCILAGAALRRLKIPPIRSIDSPVPRRLTRPPAEGYNRRRHPREPTGNGLIAGFGRPAGILLIAGPPARPAPSRKNPAFPRNRRLSETSKRVARAP